MPLKALLLVSKFQTPRSIFIFKCTKLKAVYRITLIVLVIGKAQFRRAMLSCDSSCFDKTSNVSTKFLFIEANFSYAFMDIHNDTMLRQYSAIFQP